MKKPKIKVGQFYKHIDPTDYYSDHIYILAVQESGWEVTRGIRVGLVSLMDGRQWDDNVKVEDWNDVSKESWLIASKEGTFKKIYVEEAIKLFYQFFRRNGSIPSDFFEKLIAEEL